MSAERIAVVTGASSGIGREAARLLAAGGWRVLGIGRDPARCRKAEEALRESTGTARVDFETADLASQAEIRTLSSRIAARFDRVDALLNNAGTFVFSRVETVDGIELQFAVNHLAGFLLTGLLLPLLQASPAARVVTTSSGSHFAGRIRWNDVMLRRGYTGLKAYDQSKLATVLFTKELARRLGPRSSVSAYAVDPGLVKTDIGMKGNNPLVRLAWRVRSRGGISPAEAAASLVHCAADPRAGGMTGLYWKECSPRLPSRAAGDPEAARRLWELSERLCGLAWP